MKGYAFAGKLYQWHRNGMLKAYVEKDDRGRYIRTVHWDEDGTVTYLCENGGCIINKEY